MREKVFRSLLGAMEKKTPELVLRMQLQILSSVTARAFGARKKRLWSLPSKEGLYQYALFTGECTRREGANPRQIYEVSYALGKRLRALTGFREREDLERLVFFLYRNIGITMGGSLPGEVVVEKCFFSRFYEPAQCALMSAMDSGIVSGICAGEKLVFSKRITQGDGQCRARLWAAGRKD